MMRISFCGNIRISPVFLSARGEATFAEVVKYYVTKEQVEARCANLGEQSAAGEKANVSEESISPSRIFRVLC